MSRIKEHKGPVLNSDKMDDRSSNKTKQKPGIKDDKRTNEEKSIDPVLLPIGDPAGAA